MTGLRNDGILAVAIGVSRSGKSVWLKSAIANDRRVLAFDPNGEYMAQLGFKPCRTRGELLSMLKASKGAAKIAYVKHDKKEFDFFCDAAFNWNRVEPCTAICEELANVTNVGKADGNWGRLVCQGLKYGPKILATVQRGQEVDKTVMNNATFLHIARHSTEKDRAYIADSLGLSISDIPPEKLQFIQWTSDLGLVCSGRVEFRNGKPIFWDGQKKLTFNLDGTFAGVKYR